MPSGYCPCCGATYDSPKLSPNGPFCRFCLPRGDIVPLLPVQRRRFARTQAATARTHPAELRARQPGKSIASMPYG